MLALVANFVVVILVFVAASLFSCSPSDCPNPVRSACEEKAAQIAPQLAQAAAQQKMTPELMTTEFIGVCEGQLQQDLDMTLPAILAIVDAGANDQ